MKRLPLAATIALSLFATAVTAAAPVTPSFTSNASVHDPSVIKVGDRFYVFGSHGASAWTTDLMNWTQVSTGVSSGSPALFSNVWSELSDLKSWTQADTLWAADVFQMPDGKFYYYYNVWTNYLNYRSYLGVASSSNILGPYKNVGVILKGGTGVSGFNPAFDPNTVDPTLYRSTDNKLWMVYGSYSGGIFVLEMDETTGLQKPGQGWGVKLLDGRNANIEGPFIDYNGDTGYYYLFLSYGGLNAGDGYQMRVLRSQSPTGPFFDPAGTNMSTASTANWTEHGLKLAGGWQFVPVPGELAQSTTGYLSPGHNSVIKDPATGKWFNLFHTRFVGRGEAHEVRVHQLFFNEEGWPVMAPHRYAGETQGAYTAAEIAGSYKVINHGKDVTRTTQPKQSTVIGLNANGSVDSSNGGSWSLVDSKNIRITLEGVLYKGVVLDQWDNENKLWVKAFTAVSGNGVSLWGSEVAIPDRSGEIVPPKMPDVDDLAIPYAAKFTLDLANLNDSANLYLVYDLVEAPDGMTIGADTGLVEWTPLPSQSGAISQVRARVYDALDPSLADQASFSIYVENAVSAQGVRHDFDAAATSGIKDSAGTFTGFTARLSGTGAGYAAADPNLTLDPAHSRLLIKTTTSDFNGQAGVAVTSAVGHKLSEFGYTGGEDFSVSASFGPIANLGFVDQIGVFVGSSATTLTRAGIIMLNETQPEPQGLGAHTQNGTDVGATFSAAGFDLTDGVEVTIARQNGQWSYLVDGVTVNPQTPNADFLNGLADLTVGVFAIAPLNSNVKSVAVDSFTVSVASDDPPVTRLDQWKATHFGSSPAAGVSGDADDPDHDKLPNRIEYALGADPLVANPDALRLSVSEEGALALTFSRIDDPALTYKVIAVPSLDADAAQTIWRSSAAGNVAGEVAVKIDDAFANGASVFLQLSVDSVE